jgi:tryptophan synthase alpha chain
MNKIEALFARLRSSGKKALMPFLTAGDPDLEFTAAVIGELVRRGCHLCELGIPYSDPVADGPVIQASYNRALGRNLRVAQIFQMLDGLLPGLAAPLVTMVSYSIIYRQGLDAYVSRACQASVSGLIVPDLPVEEAGSLAAACRRNELSLIQLITPTTGHERAKRIAEQTTGFIYYVSVTGITGERTELPPDIADNVAWLRGQTPLPICIGFGISRPEHVRLLAPVADGLIVGSALVRRMAEAETRARAEVLAGIGQYVAELLAALG